MSRVNYIVRGIGILFLLSGLAMLWLLVLGLIKFSFLVSLTVGLVLILGMAIAGGALESDNSGQSEKSNLR